MENKILQLVEALSVTSITKSRIKESVQLMLDAKNKIDCSKFGFEISGMLSTLESEDIISGVEFKAVSNAISAISKAKHRAFYLTERAIDKAQKA